MEGVRRHSDPNRKRKARQPRSLPAPSFHALRRHPVLLPNRSFPSLSFHGRRLQPVPPVPMPSFIRSCPMCPERQEVPFRVRSRSSLRFRLMPRVTSWKPRPTPPEEAGISSNSLCRLPGDGNSCPTAGTLPGSGVCALSFGGPEPRCDPSESLGSLLLPRQTVLPIRRTWSGRGEPANLRLI